MEQEIVNFTRTLINDNIILAYIFFFFNSCLQILFPPYPGDTIIILQGYLASKNILNTIPALFSTLSGTYLSSILLYILSKCFGQKLVSKKSINKLFNMDKLTKMEVWFKKFGVFAIIITKFIPGFGSLTLIAAGIFKVPQNYAFIAIGISVLIHNTLLFFTGRITGNNISYIKRLITEYNQIFIIGLILLGLVYIYIKVRNAKINMNNKKSS